MALFEPPDETASKRRHLKFVVGALLILAAGVLYLTLRFYPEQRAAQRFFDALVAGDTNTAYQLWKAKPSYRLPDFLTDWGPYGYYGPVKSYKIMKISSPSDSTSSVAVEVAVSPFAPLPDASDAEKSRRTRVVTVWMNTEDKSFSFPP
ncbi:MAG TPA: hypothetical protein VKQ28_02525 [Candidatus Acidoferrum sp.]|nr:hypothetical protein [Candidatus Acidoferrum sp.]